MSAASPGIDRVERLTNLVARLLSASRPITLDEIANEIEGYPPPGETRRQAFERDKRLLRDEGVPVEAVPLDGGGNGYRIKPDEYYLPDLDLTDDELVALNLAVAAVHLEAAWGRDALWKLGASGGDAPPALAALPTLPALPVFFDGVWRRATATFGYRGEARRLDPYGVAFRGGHWYVSGHDHARGAERMFRVDRVEGDVELGPGDSFVPPGGYDPAAATPGPAFAIPEDPPELVDVEVDASAAEAVLAELGDVDVLERRDDGAVVIRLTITNRAGLRLWLFGLLDHARVVGPPEVRDDVVSWLKAMAGTEA